jgi:oligoribonuclease
MKEPMPTPVYLWFDAEYSDLDLDRARLLEVAMIATDSSLRRLRPRSEDVRLTVRLPPDAPVSTWVTEHLPELVTACRAPQAVAEPEADARLAAAADAAAGPAGRPGSVRPVLAGNSIHCDWILIRRFLPEFARRLHYRHLDVTALKLLWRDRFAGPEFNKDDAAQTRAAFPEADEPFESGRHDAYYDVRASISELNFYLSRLERRP